MNAQPAGRLRALIIIIIIIIAAAITVPAAAAPRTIIRPVRFPGQYPSAGDASIIDSVAFQRARVSFDTTPDATAESTFNTVDAAGGDWYLGVPNDQTAQLAWGESYVMMAYLAMYEATGQRWYLDKFARHAAAAVSLTDRARGVVDYRGRSTGAWRCGGAYTVAKVRLEDAAGRPLLAVMSRFWKYNNATEVSVSAGSTATTFNLSARNGYVGSEYYQDISMNPRSRDYVRRRVDPVSRFITTWRLAYAAEDSRAVPAPEPSTTAQPLYYGFVCQTGMISYPLARFYNVVRSDPALWASYETTATRCLAAARRAVAAHDGEWVDDGERGYWRFRRGAPVWSDGVEVPHNKLFALGRTLIELHTATGSSTYLARATKLATLLKAHTVRDQNNAYLWNYWWGRGDTGWSTANSPSIYTTSFRGAPRSEDLAHGGPDVDFARMAAEKGLVFEPEDLIRFANTFHANMTRPDGTLNFFVNGTGDEGAYAARVGIGGWAGLSVVSRDVHRTISANLAARLMTRQPKTGALLYALASAVQAKKMLDNDARPLSAPTVGLLGALPATETVSGDFRFDVSATAWATPSVWFFVDRTAASVMSEPPYSHLFNTTQLRDGWHTFRAVAYEPGGRTSVVKLRLLVDNP